MGGTRGNLHGTDPNEAVGPQPFDQPFMLALMQGLGVGANALDPAKAPAFPATLEVDWVKVWE